MNFNKTSYSLRIRLSNFFLWAAKKLHPTSPALKELQAQLLLDQLLYGVSITRISPKEYFKNPEDDRV